MFLGVPTNQDIWLLQAYRTYLSTNLQAYRTYKPTNLQTYRSYRTYKPISIEQKPFTAWWPRWGRRITFLENLQNHLGGLLEASWRALGRFLEVLEVSWGVLEASWNSWGGLGGLLRLLGRSKSVPRALLKGPRGGPRGSKTHLRGSRRLPRRLGNVLEPLWKHIARKPYF